MPTMATLGIVELATFALPPTGNPGRKESFEDIGDRQSGGEAERRTEGQIDEHARRHDQPQQYRARRRSQK
jgi:hypothetical protein